MKGKNHDLIAEYATAHKAQFYRIAYSYTRNSDNALDVVQEATYKALVSAEKLREPQYIKTWFHRILVNTAIDFLRKNKKYQLTDQESQLEGDSVDTYENLDLKKALEILPDEQRMVVILRYFEDMKIQEVAEVLEENVSTIKTRLYSALKKLKLALDGQGGQL